MKALLNILNPRELCKSEHVKPTVILVLSALLLTVHRYFGSMEFARRMSPSISDFGASVYMFGSLFILFGVVPFVIIRFFFKQSLREYGVLLGDWKKGLTLAVILFILISLLFIFPSSLIEEMRAAYPFDQNAGNSVWAFARFEIVRVLLFYTAWEFFFRGFMLFGLRETVGDWMAICIQVVPSCLWHIGLPTGEIFASIVAGFLFGMLAVRTRSLIWPFLLHSLLGVGLDFFIVLSI